MAARKPSSSARGDSGFLRRSRKSPATTRSSSSSIPARSNQVRRGEVHCTCLPAVISAGSRPSWWPITPVRRRARLPAGKVRWISSLFRQAKGNGKPQSSAAEIWLTIAPVTAPRAATRSIRVSSAAAETRAPVQGRIRSPARKRRRVRPADRACSRVKGRWRRASGSSGGRRIGALCPGGVRV